MRNLHALLTPNLHTFEMLVKPGYCECTVFSTRRKFYDGNGPSSTKSTTMNDSSCLVTHIKWEWVHIIIPGHPTWNIIRLAD